MTSVSSQVKRFIYLLKLNNNYISAQLLLTKLSKNLTNTLIEHFIVILTLICETCRTELQKIIDLNIIKAYL